MHNAPSVSYPVGRCAFQCWLYVFFALLTSAVLLAWALHQTVTVFWLAGAATAALGGYQGWQALKQVGILTWDGQVWCLHDQGLGHEDLFGDVDVALDIQKALLLRWQPASDTLNGKPQWLWLGLRASEKCWQDLRRAVYQRTDM